MGINKSKIQSYIEKHKNHKKWIALMLCATLLTGTGTMYVLNKPATAMTAEGAESIGVVMDSASAESESTFWEPISEGDEGESETEKSTEVADSSETGAASDENGIENDKEQPADEGAADDSSVTEKTDGSASSEENETGDAKESGSETATDASGDNSGLNADETVSTDGVSESTLSEAQTKTENDSDSEDGLTTEEQKADDNKSAEDKTVEIPESVDLADYVTETVLERLSENGEWEVISKEDIKLGDELKITYKYSIPKTVAASDDIHMDIPSQYGKAESESTDLTGQNGTYEVTDDNEIKIQYSDDFKAVIKGKLEEAESMGAEEITVGRAVFDAFLDSFVLTAHAEEGDNINGQVSARMSLAYDPSKDNTTQGVEVINASIVVWDSSGQEVTYSGSPENKAETIKIENSQQLKLVTEISVDPKVVTEDNNVFFLDLGYRGIIPAYGMEKQPLYDSQGNQIGTYDIVCDEQGKSYAKFVIDHEKAKLYEKQALVGHFDFWMSLDRSGETTTEEKIIRFNDEVTFKIEVTDKNKYDLAIEKTAPEGYNKETGKIKYHVVIRTTKGTGGDIKLEDIISVNNNWQLSGKVVTANHVNLVGCWKFNGEPAATGGEWISVNLEHSQNEQNKFGTTLPGLDAGQSYVLDYEYDVPDEFKNNPSGVELNNKVSGQTENVDKRETNITTKIEGYYPNIDKHGDEVSTNDKEKKIKWTIVLNSNHQSLEGYTLKDVFITKSVNGELVRTPYTGKMHIEPALPGNISEIDVTENGYTFNFWGNTEAALKTYTLTYEVPYYDYQKIDGNRIVNEASLNPNTGEPITDTGEVYPGETVNPVEKDGTGYELDTNDKIVLLNWKVTLKAPIVCNEENGGQKYWVYYDELDNGQIITQDQLNNLQLKGLAKKKCKVEGLDPVTLADAGTTGYRRFSITVYEDLTKGNAELTYKTTALKENAQKTYVNTGYVYNKDFSDTGTNEYSPIISKYDGTGKHGDSDPRDYADPGLYNQGILTWRIKVDIPAGVKYKELTITDTLPDNVTLLTDGLYAGQQLYGLEVAGNDSYTDAVAIGESGAVYGGTSFKRQVDGQNVIVTFKPDSGSERKTLWFRVRAKVKDDLVWTKGEKKEFTNHVSIKEGKDKELGFDDQKQIITKDDSVISKTGNQVSGNLNQIEYTVDINPQNRKLLEHGTLTLHDSLTTYFDAPYGSAPPISVEFVRENFKVEVDELDENGNVTRTRALGQDEFTYHQTNSEPRDISNNKTNSDYEVVSAIEIAGLPADRHIRVYYTYYFAGKAGINVRTTNTAYLEGLEKEEVTNPKEINIYTQGSNAGMDAKGINLIKVDRDNAAITLPEAVFKLYKWDAKNGNAKYVLQDKKVTTDERGIAAVTDLDFNTAYYLEEENPPKGYLINTQKLYFCIRNDDTKKYPVYIPGDFDGIYAFGGENLEFADVKEKTSISVDKVWDYSNNPDNTLQTQTVDVIIGRRYGDLITENNDTYYSVNVLKRQTNSGWNGNGIVQYKGLPSVPAGKKVTVSFYLYRADSGINVRFTHNGTDIDLTALQGYTGAAMNGGYVNYSFIVNEDTTIDLTYNDNPPDFTVTLSDEAKRGPAADPLIGTEDTSFKLNKNLDLPDANKIVLSNPDWHKTIEGLDKYIYVGDKRYKALYYVQEITGYGYDDSYSDNKNGISEGTITITNTRNDKQSYTLPSTGGTGTVPYTMGGLFVILMSMLGCFLFGRGGYSRFNYGLYAKAFKQSAHLHLYRYSNTSKQTRFKRGERIQMRGLKTLLTGVLAGVMALSMTFTAGTAITAKADGPTGKVTITNATKGEVYQGYKIFDATISNDGAESGDASAISYKWAGTDEFPANDYFKLEGGYVVAQPAAKDAADDSKLSKGAVEFLKSLVNGSAKDGETPQNPHGFKKTEEKEATDNTVIFEGLDYGYWYFTSTVGTVISIDSTNPAAEVKDKNVPSTSDKQVEEDSIKEDDSHADGDEWGDRNDADFLQTVNYRSTILLKPGQRNVVFHDQMQSTLALDKDSIAIAGLTKGTDYSVDFDVTTDDGTDTFAITFTQDYLNSIVSDTTLTIAYSATLTKDAKVGPVEGGFGNGNDNKSKITYGNKQKTEWDWTRTYTWSVDIFKYTGTIDTPQPLAGAKFKAYYEKDSEFKNPLKFVDKGVDATTGVQVYDYDSNNGTVTELVTPESGKITVRGVDADKYVLVETEAPDGFNKLENPIKVTVESGTNTQVVSKPGQSNGQTGIKATVKQDDAETSAVNVLNKSGALLPSTGGIGTTIFYIIGGLLIIAAVVFFVVRRKADAE